MELFEVGDQVYLPTMKHYGTIVGVRIEKPHQQPQAADVRGYHIKLDDGAKIMGIYRGIERAKSNK